MVNYSETSMESVVAHLIGHPSEKNGLVLSPTTLNIEDKDLYDVLLQYFLGHFKEPEYFNFTLSSAEPELNPLFHFVAGIFDNPASLYEQSVHIAYHLYHISTHPSIKPGDLYVSYFNGIIVDDEKVDAVGIFKSENKDLFIKLENDGHTFHLLKDNGTNISKMDKGCLILNTDREKGFKICNIDHSNKFKEAQYWREKFLMITESQDDYHQTKHYILATKQFITDRMSKEFDTSKSDEADVMNRSFEYFKNNERFDALTYETNVFKDGKVVEAFQEYKQEYQDVHAASMDDEFAISDHALKKQSRVFRSIIRLDKNFHIYIHGDKNKIVKGKDDAGRKYYILYYEDES